jgi:hypothetical protein
VDVFEGKLKGLDGIPVRARFVYRTIGRQHHCHVELGQEIAEQLNRRLAQDEIADSRGECFHLFAKGLCSL